LYNLDIRVGSPESDIGDGIGGEVDGVLNDVSTSATAWPSGNSDEIIKAVGGNGVGEGGGNLVSGVEEFDEDTAGGALTKAFGSSGHD
jgi:hypothetical protein